MFFFRDTAVICVSVMICIVFVFSCSVGLVTKCFINMIEMMVSFVTSLSAASNITISLINSFT